MNISSGSVWFNFTISSANPETNVWYLISGSLRLIPHFLTFFFGNDNLSGGFEVLSGMSKNRKRNSASVASVLFKARFILWDPPSPSATTDSRKLSWSVLILGRLVISAKGRVSGELEASRFKIRSAPNQSRKPQYTSRSIAVDTYLLGNHFSTTFFSCLWLFESVTLYWLRWPMEEYMDC